MGGRERTKIIDVNDIGRGGGGWRDGGSKVA